MSLNELLRENERLKLLNKELIETNRILRQSKTVTIENITGTRTKIRQGKKKKQKTVWYGANKGKVTFTSLDELKLYTMPYDFPDKIFLGIYPESITIDQYNYLRLFEIFNIAKWYVNNTMTTKMYGNSAYSKYLKEAYNFKMRESLI